MARRDASKCRSFGRHSESSVAVNGCYFFDAAGIAKSPRKSMVFCAPAGQRTWQPHTFVQILGKLYFVQLNENLRRILFDYAQKRARLANPAFNAAC
jgi:hypothetical protein